MGLLHNFYFKGPLDEHPKQAVNARRRVEIGNFPSLTAEFGVHSNFGRSSKGALTVLHSPTHQLRN